MTRAKQIAELLAAQRERDQLRTELAAIKAALRLLHDAFHKQPCICYISDLLKGAGP